MSEKNEPAEEVQMAALKRAYGAELTDEERRCLEAAGEEEARAATRMKEWVDRSTGALAAPTVDGAAMVLRFEDEMRSIFHRFRRQCVAFAAAGVAGSIAAGAGWAAEISEEIVLVLGVFSAIFLLSAATSYIANRWLLAKGSLFDHFLEAKRSFRARMFKRAFLGYIWVALFLILVGTTILHGPAMGLGFLSLFVVSLLFFGFRARARNRRNADLWEWFENLE